MKRFPVGKGSLIDKKYGKLKSFILEKGGEGVVVAFSGGVDSSTLAKVSFDLLGGKVVAVTAKSSTYPKAEIRESSEIAREIGIKHYFIQTDELRNENFVSNPPNRCYFCKLELLSKLKKFASHIGFKVVFEGTNTSDLKGHRPGYRAVKELKNVYSPWVETGFTKAEIRELAAKLGLSIHSKPPLACLASRFPFGQRITREKLMKVDQAEEFIKRLTGVKLVRVRDHNGLARIEVGKDEREKLLKIEKLEKISCKLRKLGFKFITLDLEGYRTGSMLKGDK